MLSLEINSYELMTDTADDSVVTKSFEWNWDHRRVTINYDIRGQGDTVLLLPAFSTVSTREEMAGIACRLSRNFRTIALDWPGFGRCARPRLDYQPVLYHSFLSAFVERVVATPAAVIAAGHAASYALTLGRQKPGIWSGIALIAPTWRGPLPTMMGGYRPLQRRIRQAVYLPGMGPVLYRLNTLKPIIAFMYREHVYADPDKVTPQLVAAKTKVARQRGARFASAAFVTGTLDAVTSREAFLDLARPPSAPTLVIYGADTPPRSRAEMEALAALPGMSGHRLERGALGVHEEYAETVADLINRFFQSNWKV